MWFFCGFIFAITKWNAHPSRFNRRTSAGGNPQLEILPKIQRQTSGRSTFSTSLDMIWLVVSTQYMENMISQLGSVYSQYDGKVIQNSMVPVTTNQ
jgi:hypothetical protein